MIKNHAWAHANDPDSMMLLLMSAQEGGSSHVSEINGSYIMDSGVSLVCNEARPIAGFEDRLLSLVRNGIMVLADGNAYPTDMGVALLSTAWVTS